MDKEADDDSEWFRREVGVEPDPGEAARERLCCAVLRASGGASPADLFISGKGTLGRRKRQAKHRDSEGDHVCGDGEPPLRKKIYMKKEGSRTDKAPSRSVAGKGRAKFRLRVRTAAARVGQTDQH